MSRPLQYAEPYLIRQEYESYTSDQHAMWAELVERRQEYLDGCTAIGLDSHKLPDLTVITGRLLPLTVLVDDSGKWVPRRSCLF